MDLAELGAFLRTRRDRTLPRDVGLPAGPRRRVPGLRRTEVAQLAGASPQYYRQLEQAAAPRPSERTLVGLARALRLAVDERDHVFHLAGRAVPAQGGPGSHVPPGLLHLLDGMRTVPAQVVTDLQVVLVRNHLAALLFGAVVDVGSEPEGGLVHVVHPLVGVVALERRSLWVEDGRQRLLWFTPTPGSDAAQKLDLLAVVGRQEFDLPESRRYPRGGSASPGPGPRRRQHWRCGPG